MGPFSGPVDRSAVVRRIAATDLGTTPEEMRAGFARLILGDDPPAVPAGVAVEQGERGLILRPAGTAAGCPVVWFHGGGYVFGSPETHLRAAAELCRHARRDVHLPRYRLAPEHPWPAQRDDALAAVSALDGPVVLAGDSAGGHLALVAALRLARAGAPPAGLVLFSPNTDRSGRNAERAMMSNVDPMVDDADDRRLFEMCFGTDYDPEDPEVSPLLDDLSLLPPTWVEVGLPEVLRGDSVALQHAARCRGGSIDLTITPGLVHMGQLWAPGWVEANASLARAAAFLRRLP